MSSLRKSDIIRDAERRFKGRITSKTIREFFDFLEEKTIYGLRDNEKVSLGFVTFWKSSRVLEISVPIYGKRIITKPRLSCSITKRVKEKIWQKLS